MLFIDSGARRIQSLAIGGALVSLLAVGSAHGGVVVLGNSGWQAAWDSSLDPFVSINLNGVNFDPQVNAVFIEKIVEFTQAPVNGIFPSVAIVFQQISTTAVANIVIDDEVITNSTGVPWGGFQMDVLNHGEVFFDPIRTAASGGSGPIGWSIAPFTTASYSNNDSRLTIGGGTVGSPGFWFPGSGASNGQLWINVVADLSLGNTLFVLKETPLVPAPGALALLGVAALAGSRRRRHG